MEILIKAIQMIMSLSILVLLHELGHFIAAKLFKIRVERFFLFFDPKFALFKKKIGETTYGLGWLPLGGYVKLAGMVDESLDKEYTKEPPKPWEFRSKPAWQRLIVMIGGIVVNVLLAIFIFSYLSFSYGDTSLPMKNLKYGIEVNEMGRALGLENGDKILSIDGIEQNRFEQLEKNIVLGNSMKVEKATGEIVEISIEGSKKQVFFDKKESTNFIFPRVPAIVYGVAEGSIAQKMGLQKEDEIIEINLKPVLFRDEIKEVLAKYKNKKISIAFNRAGTILEKKVFLGNEGVLGVYFSNWRALNEIFKLEKTTYTLGESLVAGYKKTWNSLSLNLKMFKHVFSPETKAYKQIGSIFSISKVFSASWDWQIFWILTATLSIWLAFVNLLPIPSLDGGYVLFTLIEIIRGKKVNEKFLEKAITFGFMILGTLMIFLLGWDAFKVFFS